MGATSYTNIKYTITHIYYRKMIREQMVKSVTLGYGFSDLFKQVCCKRDYSNSIIPQASLLTSGSILDFFQSSLVNV